MGTMLSRLLFIAILAGGTGLVFAGEIPDVLVTQDGDSFAPGAATAWAEEGGVVVFTLAPGVDAEQVAAILRDRLAAATVTVDDGKINVAGVPQAALLGQLSTLSLSGEGSDPLADLAGLGGAVAMGTPEGGGSIRATNPSGLAPPRVIDEHDPKERVQAEVVAVARGPFPTANLKLKLLSAVKTGPLKKKLRKGKTVEAAVILPTSGGNVIDYEQESAQRNVVAYYLTKGDHVTVHAIADADGKMEIDFIERAE